MIQNEALNEAKVLHDFVTGFVPEKPPVKDYAHLFNY